MLSLRALEKRYPGPRERVVLAGVDLELAAGDYVAIMGESGVGKSTLLNLIAGLDRADAGSVRLGGTDLTALDDDALTVLRRERLGFVFQAFHVLPYLSVAQNVALPLALLGVPAGERESARRRDARRRRPRRIAPMRCRASSPAASCSAWRSRGRWCIGRCWCWPTSPPAISTPRAPRRSWRCCATQVKDRGAAGILVTHSLAAARTADRILVLGREGLRERAD